jgi:hypothetical protein
MGERNQGNGMPLNTLHLTAVLLRVCLDNHTDTEGNRIHVRRCHHG